MELNEYLSGVYDQDIIDEATEYANEYDHDILGIKLIDSGVPKKYYEKLHKIFKDIVANEKAWGFLMGASYAVENKLEAILKKSANGYDKDFCVVLDYGDNDFSGIMESAAKTYADNYNSLVEYMCASTTSDTEREHFMKRLEKMESLEYIQKILKLAVVSSLLEGKIFHWDYYIDKQTNPDDLISNAIKDSSYLKVDDINNFRKGTYEEIEEYVKEHYKNQQTTERGEGQSLETCWLNGEVLFIRVKKGHMKVWTQ